MHLNFAARLSNYVGPTHERRIKMTSQTKACIRKNRNGDHVLVIQHPDCPPFAIKVHDWEDAKRKIEDNLKSDIPVDVSTIDINDI